jgi:murein DD-endopeptidase MepM/ murein hydrolase activator NlpD
MNHRFGVIAFGILVSAFSWGLFPERLAADETVHTVRKGETLYSIARSFGIGSDQLMKFNGITDPAKLQAGQRLRIPGDSPLLSQAPKAGDEKAAPVRYRVVRHDTLYGIARQHGVSLNALIGANGISSGYVLKEGDMLTIPAPSAASLPGDKGTKAAERAPPVVKTTNTPVRWPVDAREVSYMTGKLSGVVLTGLKAEPVKSLVQGTVVSAGPYRGFGRVAIVQVAGGYLYVYGGCETLTVKEGDKVGPGTELGRLGIDAVSAKPQLFFMVYRGNTPVDPAKAPRA